MLKLVGYIRLKSLSFIICLIVLPWHIHVFGNMDNWNIICSQGLHFMRQGYHMCLLCKSHVSITSLLLAYGKHTNDLYHMTGKRAPALSFHVEVCTTCNSYINTVRCRYNAVNFLKKYSHKRHPIARPLGRGTGCILWIQHMIDIPPEFLQ